MQATRWIFVLALVLSACNPALNWREVRFEFTAPDGALNATIGTVLHGTGTAWFDDVSLETAGPPPISAVASAPLSSVTLSVTTNCPPGTA